MIREATHADLDALVTMGERFHDSTPYADELARNAVQYRTFGGGLINSPDGVLLLREGAGAPIGMLGGAVFDHPLSGERTAGEMFWYAPMEHRGTTGVQLLRAFEKWARARGATLLQMVQPAWADRVGDLYAVLGYKKLEIAWTKRL